ncbi:MAG: DUF1583 domain-containing protein [Gemmataceae bacterium]
MSPDRRHPWGGSGLATKFGLKGDFEITTTVEILAREVPQAGYGAGVRLYINKKDSRIGATLCRMVRPGGKEIVLWDFTEEKGQEKTPSVLEGTKPCKTDKVKLRLKRTGVTLQYLWAPADSDEFSEIKSVECGDHPVHRVTLTAINGKQPISLEARLIDFRIK